MSDDAAQPQERGPSKRGEAAWRQELEGVASRNDATRKAGKKRREAYEQQKAASRREAERRQLEQMTTKARQP
jgi:hypothetical protein